MAIGVGVIFVLAITLAILGVPIALSFALGTIALMYMLNIDPVWAFSTAFHQLHSFVFLALPSYILLGQVVNRSGIAKELASWFVSLTRVKGGLGAAAVLTNGVFGAMSGASMPALAGVGAALLPTMEEQGYPKSYSIGLLIPSATLSLMIPPSGGMILFGFMGMLPIATCFLAPFIPAVIIMCLLVITTLVRSQNIPSISVPPKVDFKSYLRMVVKSTKRALPGLLLPLICLGGIYAGLYTPVEAAIMGVVYATLIGFFVYRGLNIKSYANCLLKTAIIAGSIVTLMFVFTTLTKVLIVMQVTQTLLAVLMAISENLYVQILLINLLMILMGMFMDDSSAIITSAIILLPVARALGVDPYHMAAMTSVNMAIGIITPPVGALLYLGGHLAQLPLNEYGKNVAIFVSCAMVPGLLLTMYVPWLSTYLPHLFMGQ